MDRPAQSLSNRAQSSSNRGYIERGGPLSYVANGRKMALSFRIFRPRWTLDARAELFREPDCAFVPRYCGRSPDTGM